jgi:REP element-mobilizing transposase RayT
MIIMDSEKFQNKYRIPSARWQNWDYSANAEYFITICTAKRECLFGKIVNGEMILSEFGKIVNQEWDKSFEIRKELFCDAFVIMPNHIHAILRIIQTHDTVETHGRASLLPSTGIARRPPKSISSFAAGFKSAVTKQINEMRNTPRLPVWQTRFHDHIIRDDREYNRIANYIANNPNKWEDDRYKDDAKNNDDAEHNDDARPPPPPSSPPSSNRKDARPCVSKLKSGRL